LAPENEVLLEYAHAPDDLAALMGNAAFLTSRSDGTGEERRGKALYYCGKTARKQRG
jgi:hypothetical protein